MKKAPNTMRAQTAMPRRAKARLPSTTFPDTGVLVRSPATTASASRLGRSWPSLNAWAAARRPDDARARGVRAVIDADAVIGLVEDAQHFEAAAEPQLAADRMHDDELAPDVLRNEALGSI